MTYNFSCPYDILKNLFNSKEIKLFSEFDEKNEVATLRLEKLIPMQIHYRKNK